MLSQHQIKADHAVSFDKGLSMVKERLDRKGTTYKLVMIDSATIVDSGLEEASIIKTHLLESLETP